jgi:outer membrane protein TolC
MDNSAMGTLLRGVVVVACLVGRSQAQPVTPSAPMPLRDVVTIAVRQNPDLARARFDLALADGRVLQAAGLFDVHVTANLTGSAIKDAPIQEFTSSELQELTGQVGVNRVLPTGGTISVTANSEYVHQVAPVFSSDGVVEVTSKGFTSSLQVALTQPLLRGAGSDAIEAPLREAELARDAAQLQREATARTTLVTIATSYYQLALAWRQLEVRRATLDSARKQLDVTEALIRTDKIPQSETFEVEEAIALREQDVIGAEQQIYELSLQLRQLVGLDIDAKDLTVTPELLPDAVTTQDLTIEAAVTAAFAHSADLAARHATRAAAEVAVAAAVNAARSRLDLAVSGGPQGTAETFGGSISNGIENHGYVAQLSLTLDHAVQRRTERGGEAAARAQLSRAEVDERALRAQIAAQATRAVQRYRAAIASLDLGTKAIASAENSTTAEQKKFELGKSTTFDVLRKQEELEQARLRRASATADYLVARAQLDGLTGAILTNYHVVID